MAAKAVSGWLYNAFFATCKNTYIRHNVLPGIFIQTQNYAAKKSTREKAMKKKAKRIALKEVAAAARRKLLEKLQQKKLKNEAPSIPMARDDSWKSDPVDDVWVGKYHRWKVYPFEEAVECHREMHHPTILNSPDSLINAFIELDINNLKKVKTKSKTGISKEICYPHFFTQSKDITILAFCLGRTQEEAVNAGATTAGGKSLIRDIQNGAISINDYDYVISHADIYTEVSVLRGLLKRKFPTPLNGRVTKDMPGTIRTVKRSLKYNITLYPARADLGTIDVAFGRLDMNIKNLEENLTTLLRTIDDRKASRDAPFITRLRLLCPPSIEKFKIDFEKYLLVPTQKTEEMEETDETQETENEEMNEEAVIPSH